MALKVAPEQGWGIHWNEFHPSNPFTPVEVPLAAAPAAPQAPALAVSPQASAAPAGFSAHTVFSASAAADGFASVNFTQMNATAWANPTYFAIGGSQGGSSGTGDHAPDAQGTLKLSFYDDEWLIVPSLANEGGTSYAGYDDGGWDLAEWSLASDWYVV